ncbi:MAG: prolipoprotein diacylglyceryl transferase family protein, partial [Planctomycetota bacterium]
WFLARKPVKTGVISAAFLLTYGVLRIATEFIRLPDAQLTVPRPLGLSRGQWLSAAMTAIGLVLLVVRVRSASQPAGGWAKRDAGDAPSI